MAKSLQTTNGGTIYQPGAYSSYAVASNPTGLATTGVLMLIGEADAGPDYTLESDLELTSSYGPDQLADVLAKYKSGNLVDAFRSAISAANDTDITGDFSSAILVKTNVSSKAAGVLPKGAGTYALLADKSYGKVGNGITYQTVLAQTETVPATGTFTYIPTVGSYKYAIRVNGGARVGTTIAANASPASFVATVGALTGVSTSGGATRSILGAAVAARTLTITIPNASAPNTALFTISAPWDNIPSIGDTFILPTTAPAGITVTGAGKTNIGAYVIQAVTSTTILATKLSDAGYGSAVVGTISAPNVTAGAIALVATTDIQAFAPVTIALAAGSAIDGIGKSLEIAELAADVTDLDLLSRAAYVLGTTTPVSWVSKTTLPALLVSSLERKVTLNVAKPLDGTTESWTAGGEVALRVGYVGAADATTATLTIDGTNLTTSVSAGPGANLTIALKDYTTIQALADYINSQTGYSCVVGNGVLGQLKPTTLDRVTAINIRGQWATQPGRVKIDGYRFFTTVSNSSLVQVGLTPAAATLGLPDVMTTLSYLTGGAKGSTSDAQITSALAALESVRGNFIIPLFSRDATYDIADGLTETSYTYTPAGTASPVTLPASSYTAAGVIAAVRSHVLTMSTQKRRKNRQAFSSIETDFVTAQNTAMNIASFRNALTFQDFKQPGSDGSVQTFQPWMGAVLAASMQAAAFYRSIEFKGIDTSGVISRAGDFNPKNDGNMDDALKAGLLIAKPASNGGFIWASDQTTYGKDSNFVFNSIQAVYAADIVSLTLAQRMELAFVGQSLADVSAQVAKSYAESVLAELLRLKLLAPSDDGAARGFKNLTVKIVGNAMYVSCEIKIANAIDFIVINFVISQVVQSA